MALYDVEIKPVPVTSRQLSGDDFDTLFGPPPSEPLEEPENKKSTATATRRGRPTVQRQCSKSLSPPPRSRRSSEHVSRSNDDCLSVGSDEMRQRFARSKSETRARKTKKKQPILLEHLGGKNQESTATDSVAGTDCATAGSASRGRAKKSDSDYSMANNTDCGVVLGAASTIISPRRDEDSDSDSDSDHDNDRGTDEAFVKRKSFKSKELMMQHQRGRSKSTRKVNKHEQQDDDNDEDDYDDGAFVVQQKPTARKSGNLKDLADAVRRRSVNARDRSRSRSRLGRRGQQQQARNRVLGGDDEDEDEDDTENSDMIDLGEIDGMVHQFAESFDVKESSAAVQNSRDTAGGTDKRRQTSITRHVISKEDFEAACRETGNTADLAKLVRRASSTNQRRASCSKTPRRISISNSDHQGDDDPLALTASPRRSSHHARRTFSSSSPTKKKKAKAPKPPSLENDHADETANTKSKLLILHELEDDDLNESLRSMKSTASKKCMVPVLRSASDHQSPTRQTKSTITKTNSPTRSTNSPIRSTNSPIRSKNSPSKSPRKSASAFTLAPNKPESPPKTPSTILRKAKRSTPKAAPDLDFGDNDDDNFGSAGHDFDNHSGTSRTVSTNGSDSLSEFPSKQNLFRNTSSSAEKHTCSNGNDFQQNTRQRANSLLLERVPSMRQKPLRKHGVSREDSFGSLKAAVKAKHHHRSKTNTKDRSSLKLARKARQSDLIA